MATSEPHQSWQEEQHRRILSNEATAFAELCEVALPHLVDFLGARFPQVGIHLQEMVVIDTLLAYHAHPEKYDPNKLNLFAFLRMAVRSDLLNALDKQKRQEKRLVDIDDPGIQPALPKQGLLTDTGKLEEWLQQHSDLSRQEIVSLLEQELSEADQQFLLLMLEGVRDSDSYAAVMGISHLETTDRRKEVKRAKDRLLKKLRRFGNKLDAV